MTVAVLAPRVLSAQRELAAQRIGLTAVTQTGVATSGRSRCLTAATPLPAGGGKLAAPSMR